MIRVVLDTNIVISAALSSGGLPEAVFNLALNRVVRLCVSEAILAEYGEILGRPRLGIPKEKVETILGHVREAALWVIPTQTIAACSDPDDNIFLECAVAAQAQYLITGNQRHFPEAWGELRIVTPREFLEVFTEAERGQ
jgi:putative PIN family toxin of toxin-antitoxin system